MNDSRQQRMEVGEALEVLHAARQQTEIVVTNQGSAREWPKLSDHPLDFHYIPSAMGGAIPLGLGLALARPRQEVLVISGDGSLLMNLGCLVTVAAAAPANLTVVVLDNGVYEITGSQQTAGQEAGVDFSALAAGSGFPVCARFGTLDEWRQAAGPLRAAPGPRLLHLVVHPVTEDYFLDPPCPIGEQLRRFRAGLDECKR